VKSRSSDRESFLSSHRCRMETTFLIRCELQYCATL